MVKKRITIVAGKLEDVRLLDLFAPLTSKYDITVCATHTENLLEHYRSSLKIKVFKDISDMPGYMRGLDEELQNVDLIVGIDTARLATFQAIRTAAKTKKPTMVYVTETEPFSFSDQPNVRAIQTDVLENAAAFLAASRSSQEMLMIEGVTADKITIVPPPVNHDHFKFDEALRSKFRQYIKIEPDDFVILFRDELSSVSRAGDMITMLRIMRTTYPSAFQKVKIVFVGNGPQADELKYQAADLGLGKKVMFIHQNCEPFAKDLYCASDIAMVLRPTVRRSESAFKHWLMEASSCQVLPLLPTGHLMADFFGEAASLVQDDQPATLAREISALIDDGKLLSKRRQEGAVHLRDNYDAIKLSALVEAQIETRLANLSSEVKREINQFDELQSRLASEMEAGNFHGALLTCDDLLSRVGDRRQIKADLLCLKGDACLTLNKLEEASELYGQAVQLDDQNWRAFLGLGQLAFLSHSHEEAIKFFKKVLAKDTHNAAAMLGFGLIYRRLKMSEEAVFWLMKCMQLDKPSKKALYALTQACLEADDLKMAIDTLDRVVDIVGDSEASVSMALGQLYLRYGEIEKGKELLAKAMVSPSKLPAAS